MASRKTPGTSASLWRIDCGRYGKLRRCCGHCLSAAKGTSTSCGVLSHLDALRQIFFAGDRVVPPSPLPCSTGLLTVRHSVKFPVRLVRERSAGGQLTASDYSARATAFKHYRCHFCRILQHDVQRVSRAAPWAASGVGSGGNWFLSPLPSF